MSSIHVNKPGLYGLTVLTTITGLVLGAYQGAFNPKDILQRLALKFDVHGTNIYEADPSLYDFKDLAKPNSDWVVVQTAGLGQPISTFQGGSGESTLEFSKHTAASDGERHPHCKDIPEGTCVDYRGNKYEKNRKGVVRQTGEASVFPWEG